MFHFSSLFSSIYRWAMPYTNWLSTTFMNIRESQTYLWSEYDLLICVTWLMICHRYQHGSRWYQVAPLTTVTHYDTLRHTATHCNTLQHTATHCNTLQHTRHRHQHGSRRYQVAPLIIATHYNTPTTGINTALDDIKWLDNCLTSHPSSRADALRMFSVSVICVCACVWYVWIFAVRGVSST